MALQLFCEEHLQAHRLEDMDITRIIGCNLNWYQCGISDIYSNGV